MNVQELPTDHGAPLVAHPRHSATERAKIGRITVDTRLSSTSATAEAPPSRYNTVSPGSQHEVRAGVLLAVSDLLCPRRVPKGGNSLHRSESLSPRPPTLPVVSAQNKIATRHNRPPRQQHTNSVGRALPYPSQIFPRRYAAINDPAKPTMTATTTPREVPYRSAYTSRAPATLRSEWPVQPVRTFFGSQEIFQQRQTGGLPRSDGLPRVNSMFQRCPPALSTM